MFLISAVEEEICVPPSESSAARDEAVTRVIEASFVNKVVPSLGLVITLWDIQEITGGLIYPNDGNINYTVAFRLVVFRPFVGEVLVGKLVGSDLKGVRVSLGFFSDLFVPEANLQTPSRYSPEERTWVWDYDEAELFLDLEDTVRVRVKEVRFHPIPTPAQMRGTAAEPGIGTDASPYRPMEVIADMNADGLGSVGWWSEAVAE
eukprot:jgi/Tetstr1/460580/TSEL_000505.t1